MSIETDEIALILSGVKILQNLDTEIINEIAEYTQIEQFEPGDLVVKAGETGKRLYFIYEGRVEVRVPDLQGDIKRRILLKKGEVVGEISLLIKSSYTADVVALDKTTTFYLDQQHFTRLVGEHTSFSEVMSQLMTSRMAQNGGISKVGKYDLRGKLGEGSMATVFNAWDPDLEREVAIKMLKYKLAYDDKFVKRFEREARIIASLNRPNIVNVFEVIEAFSTRFIVMEKLHGQDLLQIIKDKGAIDFVEARSILSQLSSALHYAHGQGESGIVHRDIKPSNIVIDHYGNIKLTDFGIAGPSGNKEESIEGTPNYLAPEIINGEAVDGRADIYALGVLAFYMLTNSVPFSASTLAKLLKMQVEQKPPDIRNICPEIDDELAGLIDKSLSKEADQRISDWEQIRDVLKPVAGDFNLSLGSDEMAVIIRFKDTSPQRTQRFIKAIEKNLLDKSINYEMETHQGSNENE